MYATVVLAILLIATINLEPFKKIAARYPSTDPIFLILLCLFYMASSGRSVIDTRAQQDMVYNAVMLCSAFGPLAYIVFLVGFWFVSSTTRARM